MKKKYYWDIEGAICFMLLLVMIDVLLFIMINEYPKASWLLYVILLIANLVGIVRFVIGTLKDTTTFTMDTITVTRSCEKPYSVSARKIKRIYVSMQYFAELTGRDYKLTLTANDLQGVVLGINKQMLQAVLAIYPHLKFVVLCPVRKLGKDNAILLAQRGYLNEQQLKEAQKRYRLPEGFEKVA